MKDLTLDWSQDKFEKQFADIIALLKGGTNELYTKMAAETHVHPEMMEHVFKSEIAYKNAAPEYREIRFQNLLEDRFLSLCQMFIRLQERKAFNLTGWTQDANDAYLRMLEISGFRQAAPPPPPPKTSAELLEDQVIAEFNGGLSADKFRQKLNTNVAYRDAYNRLAETNRLESRVTKLHDVVGG